MTKFLNISTDNTLGGNSPSDDVVSSQKAIQEYIANAGTGANTSLSNLTSTGQNIGNWSSNVTNCITEIPQDIKLELNSRTLTLKAGSKVYVPNGAGVFDIITIASDLTHSFTGSAPRFAYYDSTNNELRSALTSNANSGTTPSGTGLYYNTSTNNIDYLDNGTGRGYKASFPLCISNSDVSAIYQVFNGFGYIGKTLFALPGVKGLIPNNRNTDGTLNNTEFTSTSVVTRTLTSGNFNAIVGFDGTGFGVSDILITEYNQQENLNYSGSSVWNECFIGSCSLTSGVISNFVKKQVFHAVDYSDFVTKADNNAVVHLAGAETITGKKRFVSANSNYSGAFTQKTSYIPNNYTKPSNDQSSQCFEVTANDDTYLSWQVVSRRVDGTTGWQVSVRNRQSSTGSNQQATLGLLLTNTGTGYTYAPASDVTNSIVTTVNRSKSTNGYFKLGNGMIVQWGTYTVSAQNGTGTITLPTAFSSTNYSVVTTAKKNTDGVQLSIITSQTSSQFSYRNYAYASMPILWIAVGY